MILTKAIPINAQDFIRRCSHDWRLGNYAKNGDYLEFLIEETRRSHPKLLEYIRVVDRRAGKPRYHAQADHIIPRAVWRTLMPRELGGTRGEESVFVHVLSNLFWRGPVENQSIDQLAIRQIRREATTALRQAPAKRQEWCARWIEIFLVTKRDEALVFPGDLVDLSVLDRMPAGAGTNWMGGH